MAKDRFSKFKPIFWNKKFKYGVDPLKEGNEIKRRRMEDDEYNRVYGLLEFKNLTEWEIGFIHSILKWRKELTMNQIRVIRKIIKKNKQTNIQAEQLVHSAKTEG